MLVGRDAELERVRETLDAARAGRTSSLVLAGDAGVGKSALLEAAADGASDLRVLRTRGVEAEAELSFAALVELIGPVAAVIERLPEPQAAVLEAILALSAVHRNGGESAAATLSLLAAAADDLPLLVLVDDAHWLDSASGLALAFAARRAREIPLAFVFATRTEDEPRFSLEGIARLAIEPLEPRAAERLIAQSHPSLDEATAARILEAGAGNPLALLELPDLVTDDDRWAGIAEPLPAGDAARRLFGRRLEQLMPDARLALVTAAAARGRELRLLKPAWDALGLGDAITDAERSGLVILDGEGVDFRHALVRSLAYAEADPSERRRVHAALASTGPHRTEAERDEAVWHAALAATGPADDVSSALAELAARSPAPAAATAYERAGRLTPEARLAAERLLAAAGAAHEAGEFQASVRLATEARDTLVDPVARAEAERLIALAEFERDRPRNAVDRLERAAGSVSSVAPRLAARMLAETVEPCAVTGQTERGVDLARRALDLAAGADPVTRLHVRLRHSDAHHWAGRFPEARALALEAARAAADENDEELEGLDGLLLQAEATFSGGDLERAQPLWEQAVREARSAGALTLLRLALGGLFTVEFQSGRVLPALAAAEEELELAQGLARRSARIEALGYVAWCDSLRGLEERCRSYVAERFELAALGRPDPIVHPSLALLELSLGRFEEAVAALEPTIRAREGRGILAPVDLALLIEAYAQAGRAADAEARLRLFESDPRVINDPPSRALASRCRALLADDATFELAFERALDDHRLDPRPFEYARTLLLYGERLRREHRRLDARAQIRQSLDAFQEMGATAWARRAEDELAATGDRARRRIDATRDELTSQELVVARLVAQGLRNKEVAAQLFLSTNTIETHLRHVYRKLGIRSRTELAARFTDFRDSTAQPAA
jgi:DNA-binding CsgD family transcriptional regulator